LFFSYSQKDLATVKSLSATLRQIGWSVWFDQELRTGAAFNRVIDRALSSAQAVISSLGKLVIELIYDTFDPDVAEYLKNNKPAPGVRWHRQPTENIGVRALVSRCYEVIGMAKECRDMRELRDKVARHYGRQVVQFSLSLPPPDTKETAN
jgi:TIR domain